QAEDGIRDFHVTGVQTCALPIFGHFDLAAGDASPAFRYAILLRGIATASFEQVEEPVDIALSECERFYPAFQLVIWGGKPPEERSEERRVGKAGRGGRSARH